MARASQPRNLGRMSEIAQAAARHGFGYFLEKHRLTDLLPWQRRAGLELNGSAPSQRGAHLRAMLDELGPTFVKFGQLLSMRPDVLPPDVIAELRGLQDDVRPFPFAEVQATVEAELGLTIERLYAEFDERPIAAASIGQVHLATLPTGRRVAVKVQRPGAARQIEADLALLHQAARLAKERIRALDFIDARALVDEFGRSIRQELDFRLEARNAARFRRDFAGHPHVRIPRVYWTYSGERVLTLEYLEGAQLADLDLLGFSAEERRRLATLVTETWMRMIFRNGFFHADPHPANILMLGDVDHIGLVDFGQAGALTEDDLTKATRLFVDIASENLDSLTRRLADLGVRFPKEQELALQAELRELVTRYSGARLSELDPVQVIREVFGLIYRHNLTLPTRFVLLDKAIASVASVSTELDPDLNAFEIARPYARRLVIGRYTPRRLAAEARRESSRLARVLHETPYQLHDVLEQARDGQIEVGFVHKGLDEFMHKVDVAFNRLVVSLVVVGGLIGSSLIGIFAQEGPQVFGLHALALFGFVLSGVLGAWLLLGVVRSGRL